MPIRYLKPGICDSDTLDLCEPMEEVLFYRLLVNVDDFGRLDARPAVIKAKCFPLKIEITVEAVRSLLAGLHNKGLIILYQSDAKEYLQMCKWDNAPRAKASKYPSFDCECIQMYANENGVNANPPRARITETETETETVVKGDKSPSPPYEKILDLYHQHLPMLPRVKRLTDKRRSLIKTRWMEDKKQQDLNFWERYFKYVAGIPFLIGENKTGWQADIEFLFTEKNFVKAIEGGYEGMRP